MNYSESLKFIKSKESLGILPGLSRINDALNDFDNPQDKMKIVHIAGTNGKGTVAFSIANALIKEKYSVGVFSTPYVDDIREQIIINSNYISKSDFAKYVSLFSKYNLSEFELMTCAMYKYFYDKKVDYAIIECGMGGRDDATNVISSNHICVLTSISIDHTAFLGNTIEEITKNKCGIIKDNSTVVAYPNNQTVLNIIKEKCNDTNSALIIVKENDDFLLNDLETANEVLKLIDKDAIAKDPKLFARQELINNNIMLDGAHNVGGAKALYEKIKDMNDITLLVAMMKDKNVDEYLRIIAPLCVRIIVTEVPNNNRSMSASDLGLIAKKYCDNVYLYENPHNALLFAKTDFNFLLVAGSFYLARELRKDF